MTLTIHDRLLLVSLLPEKAGSIDEMIATVKLRKKVALTEAEREDLDLKPVEGGIVWNPEKAADIEVEITEDDKNIVRKGFHLMAAEERLPTTDNFVQLYHKFSE